MKHPRLATLLVITAAFAAGIALADPPGAASGAPVRGKAPGSQSDEASAKAAASGAGPRSVREAARAAQGHANATPFSADRLRKLSETRAERRREHRVRLFQNWGRFLDRAEVVAELRSHGERTARLRRMRFVAQTERKGPAQEKILARIDKLLEKENARHERAMQRFATALAAASGAPAPAAASGAPAAKSGGVTMPPPPMPLALPSGFKLPPLPTGSALPPGVLPPIPAVSGKLRRLPAPVASGGQP